MDTKLEIFVIVYLKNIQTYTKDSSQSHFDSVS